MKRYFLPFAAFAVVGLTGAVGLAQDGQEFDTVGEVEMLARIEAMRSAQGLPTVARDAQLDQAARLHCADMASHQALEHVSPRTGTPGDRVRRAGVTVSTIAENVALHRTTADAFESLLGSEAHRANMLDARFTHVGIGALRTPRGVYVTQVFAAEPAPAAAPVEAPVAPQPVLPAPSIETVVPPQGGGSELVQAPLPPLDMMQPPGPAPQFAGGPALEGRTFQSTVVNGSLTVVQRAPDQRIEGYWVFGSGRWWYYPMPAGAAPGQRLMHDPSVSVPPPGFPENPGAQGAPMAQPFAGPRPGPMVQPAPGVRSVQPQPQARRGSAGYQAMPPEFANRPEPRTRQEQRQWMMDYRRYLQQHPEARRRRM